MNKKKKTILIISSVVIVSIVIATTFYTSILLDKKCNYNSQTKKYIGKSKTECERLLFQCEENSQAFFDDCGCGCETKNSNSPPRTPEETLCGPKSGLAESCTEVYAPVCGWFNPEKIECIKYPCAQTFLNSCFACANKDILSWTAGECPE
ncbi:MAG: hypothetical protein AABX73_03540 [Nanoarchaeota archaeon]